jgi:cytochrome c peroxidase
MKSLLHIIFISLLAVIMQSCTESQAPQQSYDVNFTVPSNFPQAKYDFSKNPVTKDGFMLGKKLFYDGILSRDGSIACGTCHIQSSAFSQHGHDLSHGIEDRLTMRNTPGIQNVAWKQFFQWDGGVFNLDLFPVNPITAHNEMDETIENVLNKLRKHPQYPGMFKSAFGTEEITTDRFLKALSQFQVMFISAQSKYDKVKRNEGASFTAEEQAGYQVFKQQCATCHAEPFFSDESFRNNGLSVRNQSDSGRARITLNEKDVYSYIVPSLRNVMLTPPYMHDGRFETIDKVLDHYAQGMIDSPYLDPVFKQRNPAGISLSAEERTLLKSFLNTLSDTDFIRNRMLSEF